MVSGPCDAPVSTTTAPACLYAHSKIPSTAAMANIDTNLTENELRIFRENDIEADIPIISRRIRKRLDHHQAKWTTLEGHHEQRDVVPKTDHGSDQKPTMPATSPGRPVRVVLLGPEGTGKSSLGNLLVGDQLFEVATPSGSGVRECKMGSLEEDGQRWEIVDTPGSPFSESQKDGKTKKLWNTVTGHKPDSLKQIEDEVKQADVILFVLNTSHKRTPDMGIKAFKQVFPENLSKTCILLVTHGDTHYRTKSMDDLLHDIKESPDICEFLTNIQERVVIVELGDGQQSEDAIVEGTAVYGRERDQAREMVMAMVKEMMYRGRTMQGIKRHSEHEASQKMPAKFV